MKKIVLLLTVLCLFCSTVSAAVAQNAYNTYTYDSYNTAVYTASAYEVDRVVKGRNLGIEGFNSPNDVYAFENRLYLLDSGNSRIVVLSSAGTLERIIKPVDNSGEPIEFIEAYGIFVCSDGRILICDKKAACVYAFDANGKQIFTLETPQSNLIPDGFRFEPVKAIEDSGGVIYVLSAGSYGGALQFEKDQSFLGFYGSEKVAVTSKVLLNYFWKKLLTDEQAEGLERTLPVEFISFDIDGNDFIYTIRRGNDVSSGQVRKLNARGDSILPDRVYGDLNTESMLSDITVDENGFFTIIDNLSGKLFQYDADGRLLYAFGGLGNLDGCFTNAVAVESIGDNLYVLDADRNSLTVFRPTDFALDIRKALLCYQKGAYLDAEQPWRNVLKADFKYEYAGIGLGKVLEKKGDYKGAMEYYRLGVRRDLYSDAFSELRSAWIRQWLPVLMSVFVIVLVASLVLSKKKSKKSAAIYAGGRKAVEYPLYCMLHPFNGFDDLKSEKTGSKRLCGILLLAYLVISILSRQVTGFIFNPNRVETFNFPVMLITTIGLFFAFVIANWSITTIMDGKGTLKEISIFMSYALMPYIIGNGVLIILSRIFTLEEAAFYNIGMYFVYIWTGLQIIFALREVHRYSLKKTIWTTLLTLFALVVIVVLCAIIYSVFSQLFGFFGTIINELML